MTDAVMASEAIRQDIDQIVETEDNIDRTEVGLGINKIIEVISEVMQGILKDRIADESIETITEMKAIAEIEIGTGLEKGHFPETLVAIETRSTSNSRFMSGSRTSMNRDRIRYYKCKEYDHFRRDCPTSREERELEQLPTDA